MRSGYGALNPPPITAQQEVRHYAAGLLEPVEPGPGVAYTNDQPRSMTPQGGDVDRPQPGLVKFALVATTVMFGVAFSMMVALTLVHRPGSQFDAVVDTCRWIVAITAAAIVGLISRGGRS